MVTEQVMESKPRILILDDETSVAFFLRESLEALDRNLEVISVCSSEEALLQIDRQAFDLVVTDQYMPGMQGLELIEKVQKLNPATRFIVITAYGSEDVLAQAQRLGAFHFFVKPFRIEEFVETVLDALTRTDGRSANGMENQQADMLNLRLEELRREVGAQCLVAATADGAVVAQAGSPADLDVAQLLHLAAADFGTSLAMARHLGGSHRGNLTYYEGVRHDVYLANVEDDLFLLMVFDRSVQASRIGIVWLYARRAVENLRRVRAVVPARLGLD
jgi:CheY-like chemotaxis protein